MLTIPTTEPSKIQAGDSVDWTKPDLSTSFPPATWTLSYRLIQQNGSGLIDITATNVADVFTVDVTPATSAAWIAGLYNWVASVSDGTDRHTVGHGLVEILPDLASLTGTYDGRSHVKITLDAIESLLEKKPNADVLQATIGDRSITRMSIDDLLKWRGRYRALYLQELKDAELGVTGRSGQIAPRFL